jgi:uncharacterized SAM-binding protein YcdF (DUF218 family)
MNASWIVVPDGLAADAQGRALAEPSFVYRAVLDWTGARAGAGDRIYLAPANDFGCGVTEQEAGRRHLQQQAPAAAIVSAPSPAAGYIDTRGNARLLRRELERAREWPLPAVNLVAYTIHLRRAVTTFAQEGFVIDAAHAVPIGSIDPHDPATRIVRRLWYYRYPLVHHGYERLALAMTRLRVI